MEVDQKLSTMFTKELAFKWNCLSNEGNEKRYLVLTLQRPKNKHSDVKGPAETMYSLGLTIGHFAKYEKTINAQKEEKNIRFCGLANLISLFKQLPAGENAKYTNEQNTLVQYASGIKEQVPCTKNFTFSSEEEAKKILQKEQIILSKDVIPSVNIAKNVTS